MLVLLSGCAGLTLSLPHDDTSALLKGCETKVPIGECAPGGIIINHTWSF